jgi:hypothetical protein
MSSLRRSTLACAFACSSTDFRIVPATEEDGTDASTKLPETDDAAASPTAEAAGAAPDVTTEAGADAPSEGGAGQAEGGAEVSGDAGSDVGRDSGGDECVANVCGGCGLLAAKPGDLCGTCSGTYQCTDGGGLECVGDTVNACGGCAPGRIGNKCMCNGKLECSGGDLHCAAACPLTEICCTKSSLCEALACL